MRIPDRTKRAAPKRFGRSTLGFARDASSFNSTAFETPQAIFSDYAYFSSYADTWVTHARRYAEDAVVRYDLSSKSLVVEAASNDGYLLREFVARGISVLGIEPAANVAAVAQQQNVPTEIAFFGVQTARRQAAGRRTRRPFRRQ